MNALPRSKEPLTLRIDSAALHSECDLVRTRPLQASGYHTPGVMP
ncbi:hypothetical protein ABH927_005747 [Planotetraspora sp. GP83]